MGPHFRLSFPTKHCKEHCTEAAAAKFPLEWDDSVLSNPEAAVLGVVCATPTESELQEAIGRAPEIPSVPLYSTPERFNVVEFAMKPRVKEAFAASFALFCLAQRAFGFSDSVT